MVIAAGGKARSHSAQALMLEGAGSEADITTWELSRKLKGYDYCVCLAFLVSLAAFPGMVACICSVRNGAAVAPCHGYPLAGQFYGTLFTSLPFSLLPPLCVRFPERRAPQNFPSMGTNHTVVGDCWLGSTL